MLGRVPPDATVAGIVIEVKFVDPQPREVVRAPPLLAEQVLGQLNIHAQVEFLQDSIILFWQSR